MKKARRFSIGSKMYVFMVVAVVLVTSALVYIAYHFYVRNSEEFYKTKTSQMASTGAAFVDGDFIKKLVDVAQDEEYLAIREKAEETEDESLIEDWLREQGLWDEFVSNREFLRVLGDGMDVTYAYILCFYDGYSVCVMDPKEDLSYLGYVESNDPPFDVYTTNQSMPSQINYTEMYGWLSSGYEPIYDSKGEAVAVVGIDVDVSRIMEARRLFLIQLSVCSFLLAIIVAVVGIFVINRIVVNPIVLLSEKTKQFHPVSDGDPGKAGVVDMVIKSDDEIRDLYDSIRSMELNTVENLATIQQVTVQKERVEAELSIASKIQESMLPDVSHAVQNMVGNEIYAYMTPAKEVGGDFYDCFSLGASRLALVIADVSGKGVPAAIFMATVMTAIRTRAVMGGTPGEIMFDVNNMLCEHNSEDMFVTVWMGIVDVESGECISANAGHEDIMLLVGEGDFIEIKSEHDVPLALMKDAQFTDFSYTASEAETLFIYTDGIPEMKNDKGERFGTGRMLKLLNEEKGASPRELIERMRDSVVAFTGDAEPFDDMTMLCFRMKKHMSG